MYIPEYFEFSNPTKIMCGKNALENIVYELKSLQVKRPLILTDSFLNKMGMVTHVTKQFQGSEITYFIYDRIPSDSSLSVVNDVAKVYKENQCDVFIALGGGSVIDTAKAANLVVSLNENDLMKVMGINNIFVDKQPFIVIPTTSGTGSEATSIAVIKDHEQNKKMVLQTNHIMPDVSILDPIMTKSLPPKLTVTTALDALCHAIESFTCLQKNPISDVYAQGAIKLIFEHLEKVVESGENLEGRATLALASNMAGTAFSNSMVGIVHQIGHACGGVCGVPHGLAMTILLPFGMEFNKPFIEERYSELLMYLTSIEDYIATPKEKRADRAIDLIKQFIYSMSQKAGIPLRLSEAGVKNEDLESIAKAAMKDGASLPNPVTAEYEEVLTILKQAF